jgi:hypothetical protein
LIQVYPGLPDFTGFGKSTVGGTHVFDIEPVGVNGDFSVFFGDKGFIQEKIALLRPSQKDSFFIQWELLNKPVS